MNFNFGVFFIQSILWLALLLGGYGFAAEHFGISEWELTSLLACLLFSAYLVDETVAKALLPTGQWAQPNQKK